MEQAYKTALEIIKNFCERDTYVNAKDIILICETLLNREEAEENGEV